MHQNYKGHGIHSTASFLPDGWKPHLYVAFSDGGHNILKNFTLDRTFATSEKAEEAGLSFALKWIDDGRPNFETMIRQDSRQTIQRLAQAPG